MRRERRRAREGRSIREGRRLSRQTAHAAMPPLQMEEGRWSREKAPPHRQRMPLLRRRLLAPFHAFLYVCLPPALQWKLHGPSLQYFSLLSEHQEELKPTHGAERSLFTPRFMPGLERYPLPRPTALMKAKMDATPKALSW